MTLRKTLGAGPKSTDLDGWKQAIAAGDLASFALEDIACAFQDLRHIDKALESALTRYLSDAITKMARRRVGRHHPNEGDDIVLAVAAKVWLALLQPDSADGKRVRKGVKSLLEFRLKDAIIDEQRLRQAPAPHRKQVGAGEKKKKAPREEFADFDSCVEVADSRMTANIEALLQSIDIGAFLKRHIPDIRKRDAFRYYMEKVPIKSSRGHSISETLGMSDKTISDWIDEVIEILKEKAGELK